jgi:hypothetical protein
MTSAAKRAQMLISESKDNRGPVWVSQTPGLLVELVLRCESASIELDGGHQTFRGDGWVVCVVA